MNNKYIHEEKYKGYFITVDYDHWDYMDDYIRGRCYVVGIEEDETCRCCNHTKRKYIDGTSIIGDYDEAIEEAKRMIDTYTK